MLFSILFIVSSVLCMIEIDCSKSRCLVVSQRTAHRDNFVCNEDVFRIFTNNKCEDAVVNKLYIRHYDVTLRNNTYEMVETGKSVSPYFVFGMVVGGIFFIFCCGVCCAWFRTCFRRSRYETIY
jgi:hypothetical protein